MEIKNSVFNQLLRFWEFIKDIGLILKPCRFSIILLLVVMAFFILADQGQDVLRALTEKESTPYSLILWFFLALFLWAINTWYWARIMLRFNFDKLDNYTDDCHPLSTIQIRRRFKIRQYLPRFLGTFAFFLTAFAFYKTGRGEAGSSLYFTAACLVFAGIFLYITTKRRQWINRLFEKADSNAKLQKKWIKTLADEFSEKSIQQAYQANYQSLSDIPLLTWLTLGSLGAISIILFLLFSIIPGSAVVLGTASIFLMAAASWVCFGSVLVYFGSTYRFPVITLLFIAAIVFSLWNNNHEIRYLEGQKFSQRISLNDYANNWFKDLENSSEDKIPYYIIAAEGGGIRAAYWTALVLSAFQDRNAEFSRHVIALSGVSGGSLGSAVFAASLHEQILQASSPSGSTNNLLKCKVHEQDVLKGNSIQECTTAVLANDFLSPAVAYMLYPDLVQRFLPFPVTAFDRSRALEQSWESAWANVFPDNKNHVNLFSSDFFELWNISEDKKYSIPNLFLNSTWVETGKRVISSNLLIENKQFFDSRDFYTILNADVRLSTAVHNSARFTYVSPAGTLHPPGEDVWGHLVDGGYFENSGATTAFNVLLSVTKIIEKSDRFVPVVVVITNDPAVKEPCDQTGKYPLMSVNNCNKQTFMNEVISPLITMLNTRNARGSYARDEIKKYAEKLNGHYLEIGLCGGKGPLPLGWTLSDTAKTNMEQQLQSYFQRLKQSGTDFNPLDLKHLSDLEELLSSGCG